MKGNWRSLTLIFFRHALDKYISANEFSAMWILLERTRTKEFSRSLPVLYIHDVCMDGLITSYLKVYTLEVEYCTTASASP